MVRFFGHNYSLALGKAEEHNTAMLQGIAKQNRNSAVTVLFCKKMPRIAGLFWARFSDREIAGFYDICHTDL